MNTQHLKYAIEVERTGSITQAAENLYIGQPSLSKAIKELEDSLGIVIFRRTSKGAVPTERGAEFLKYARTVMVQIEKMEMLYRPNCPDRQILSLSASGGSYIAQAAAEFIAGMDTAQETDVQWRETTPLQVMNDVIRGQARLGVLRYARRDEAYFADYLANYALKAEAVWDFERMITFHESHPLCEQRTITQEMLSPYVTVVLKEESVPNVPMRTRERGADQLCEKRICVNTRVNQLELIARIRGAYTWCEALPEEVMKRYALIQRECRKNGEEFRDVLIYSQGHEFTAVEKAFIDKLYECRNRQAFR